MTAVMIAPYLMDVARDKTQPNVVSWFTWSLLMVVGTAAAISEGHYATAILTGTSGLATGAVAIFGFRKGKRKYTKFDIVCQILAIIGVILWQLTQHPSIAVAIVVVTDFVAALPTFKQAWHRPHHETWTTFAGASGGALLTVLSLTSYSFTSLAYPLYWAIASGMIAALIVYRRRRVPQPRSLSEDEKAIQ